MLIESSASVPILNGAQQRVCKGHRGAVRRRGASADLSEHDLVYLYLDAIYLKLRPDDEPAEGVLVAWGITLESKVLLGLQLGSRESYEDWLDFRARFEIARDALAGADRRRRCPGIWKATRELWGGADEQRCTVHALRNITSKLPERLHREGQGPLLADPRRRRHGRRGEGRAAGFAATTAPLTRRR